MSDRVIQPTAAINAQPASAVQASGTYDVGRVPLMSVVATLSGTSGTYSLDVVVQVSNDQPPNGADLAIGNGITTSGQPVGWQPTNWADWDALTTLTSDGTVAWQPMNPFFPFRWFRVITQAHADAVLPSEGTITINIAGKQAA